MGDPQERINTAVPRLLPIADLRPDPRNARKHQEADLTALMESLKRFGQQKPVVIRDGQIVAGHGMVEAARRLGWTQVMAIETDITDPATLRDFAFADNRTAELSIWNPDTLPMIVGEMDNDFRELMKVTDGDLKELLDIPDEKLPSDGELLAKLNVTIPDPETQVKVGQVWRLGPHTLVAVDVIRGVSAWRPFLNDQVMFCPYPGPFAALAQIAESAILLLVQPNTYIAGHLIDQYKLVHGAETVSLVGGA